jgi:hypothetical protein
LAYLAEFVVEKVCLTFHFHNDRQGNRHILVKVETLVHTVVFGPFIFRWCPRLGWLTRTPFPRDALGTFACFLMDALLAHLWAMLAHAIHSHMSLRAGLGACSMVQDEAFFTRLTVGGISFTSSAGRATALTDAISRIEAPGEGRERAIEEGWLET